MTSEQQIDQRLREDGSSYRFQDLVERFDRGLDEALRYGDSAVTVKIPSASEFTVPIEVVTAAMSERNDR